MRRSPIIAMRSASNSLVGLTSSEVASRVAAGQVNHVDSRTSRSVVDILRANILTRFNAIITALLVVIVVVGDLRDGLFAIVMVVNAIIGIVQELRAKRTLDKLTVLATPTVTVRRDGQEAQVSVREIVLDDVVVLRLGDQVPVDGEVIHTDGMQVDESLLTGEADPADKQEASLALSGSFVVSGSGAIVATAVGEDAYANKLAAEARRFALAHSELRNAIDRILQIVTWLIVPTSALLLWSQLGAGDSMSAALTATVAGAVGMVPQGLVLLVSMAFAVAVIRLGRRNALVQELPAVETLARVDTVCVDKTGTLTTGLIVHERTVALPGVRESELRDAVAAVCAAETSPNPTLNAIAAAHTDPPRWTVHATVPFSSARKWSAVAFGHRGTWILGAPEVVLHDVPAEIAVVAGTGKRVLAVARTDAGLSGDGLPDGIHAVGYVTLIEEIRSDAADTIGYFVEQHVTPKVISGDHPATVSAIASAVGVPDAHKAVDARTLPDPGSDGFVDAVNDHAVFGRVTPDRKRDMVGALQAEHHTVAMTGDGVNDVLALKSADIGIAMGSGSAATRAVAQIILLDDKFASLPAVVAEGRRVIGNMERVAAVFLTKTVYATLLAVLIGFAGLPFPFLPRHLTLIGALTIGIPTFFLSFEATEQPVRPGFLLRVFRFAVPAGIASAIVTFEVYGITRSSLISESLIEARTAATMTMVLLGLWIVIEVARPFTPKRATLVTAMLLIFGVVLLLPRSREFFELTVPGLESGVIAAIGVGSGVALIHLLLLAADSVLGRIVERELGSFGSLVSRRFRKDPP
jgi:cation-transporting ATPase E